MNASRMVIALALAAILSASAAFFWKYDNVLVVDGADGAVRAVPDDDGIVRISHRVKLRNFGVTDIKLDFIEASCSCTKIKCADTVGRLSAEDADLEVRFPASPVAAQPVDIVIKSSAKNALLKKTIFFETGNYYAVNPTSLRFFLRDSSGERSAALNVIVTSRGDAAPEIREFAAPEWLRADIEWSKAKNVEFRDGSSSLLSSGRVAVGIADGVPEGVYSDKINFEIAGDEIYRVEIPVELKILPFAEFKQDRYLFSKGKSSILLMLDHNNESEVSSAALSGEGFEILKFDKISGGGEITIRKKNPEVEKSTLTVRFNNGKSVSTEIADSL